LWEPNFLLPPVSALWHKQRSPCKLYKTIKQEPSHRDLMKQKFDNNLSTELLGIKSPLKETTPEVLAKMLQRSQRIPAEESGKKTQK